MWLVIFITISFNVSSLTIFSLIFMHSIKSIMAKYRPLVTWSHYFMVIEFLCTHLSEPLNLCLFLLDPEFLGLRQFYVCRHFIVSRSVPSTDLAARPSRHVSVRTGGAVPPLKRKRNDLVYMNKDFKENWQFDTRQTKTSTRSTNNSTKLLSNIISFYLIENNSDKMLISILF